MIIYPLFANLRFLSGLGILVLLVLSQLLGCASEDPIPPSKHVQPSRYSIEKDAAPKQVIWNPVKPVTPKVEPLSRHGNPQTYKVNGLNYEVLRSANRYKSRGLASWYGTKFHSQRTSSGEDYDMYAMTAAHKTLPLPSYMRVKNLENGRQTIVKVNDRGPFHSNRLIDLSYAAASELGILNKGTAMVEVESIAQNKLLPEANYFIQAGAFNSQAVAKNFQQRITKAVFAQVLIEMNDNRYMVLVGPLNDKYQIARIKNQLSKVGVKDTYCMLR